MKEKLLEIFSRYYPADSNNANCVNEILRIAEFEALCNPDIYEANANEHFEQEAKEREAQWRELCESKNKAKENDFGMYGWICPRCGKVHSPFSTYCDCLPPSRTCSIQYTL